jgi:hypothetical protein
MATPGQLVRTMANVLGIPEPTVAQYDRHLAEAGLRRMGGRGTSAAKVSATDAANLLIAIMGSPVSGASIKSAKETCDNYGYLPTRPNFSDSKRFSDHGLISLAKLGKKKHTFRDALIALIEGASRGELLNIIEGNDVIMGADFCLGVNVTSPYISAEIILDNLDHDNSKRYIRLGYNNFEKEPAQKINDRPELFQERHVTFRTLRLLGNLIAVGRG